MFVSKNRNGFFYLFWEDDVGKRHTISTRCKRKPEAMKFLQQFKASEREQKEKLERLLLSQFHKDFIVHSKGVHTVKTQQHFDVAFREFLRVLGDLPLHKISVRDIERFLAKKKLEASEWTARKYYTALASAFETAVRWKCILSNPFRQVEKPKVPEIQPLYFSKADLQKLLKLIPEQDFRELCLCAVSTGLRLGELLSLEWTSVDFVRKTVTVRNTDTFTTKNKKTRIVPMSDELWITLAVRKEKASCELVFHDNGLGLKAEKVSKTFKDYVLKAEVNEKLHFHSLRHTFASWLVQSGVSLYEVQKLLGHSSSSVTQVYSHLQPETRHDTVNRININLN